MSRWFLYFANKLFTLAVSLMLTAAVLYAGFALWENGQIYASAENSLGDVVSQDELTAMLQTQETGKTDKGASETAEAEGETKLEKMFRQLKEVNEDIGAWITMPGTAIDYPVVQGQSNISYISTDIYGNFAIVGSIFLDSRNQEDYSDTYSLLYGHNMSEHRMFSDVNLYKEEEFFKENQKGYIYFPSGAHWLQNISIIVTPSSNSWFMNPLSWSELDGERILELVQEDALFISPDGMEALKAKIEAEDEAPHIIALSTCSTEYTEARTILLTLMDP